MWRDQLMGSIRGESGDDPAWVDTASAPSARRRIAVALALGLASALFTWLVMRPETAIPDFPFWWRAARILAAGGNPYHEMPQTPTWPLPDRLYYPLPAVLITLPIASLPLPAAGALMMGSASAILAWSASGQGFGRLWMFASPPYILALKFGQWSPLIMSAAFLPAMGWAAAIKPPLGLAVLAYRPSWRSASLALAFALAGFLALPSWVADWRANLAHLEQHPAPVATFGGVLLLGALARWRRRDGRLLVVMACVPQLLFFADQFPLWLVPRTRGEMVALSVCSMAGFGLWWLSIEPGTLYVLAAAKYVMLSCYLPALVIVLRHRNEGRVRIE